MLTAYSDTGEILIKLPLIGPDFTISLAVLLRVDFVQVDGPELPFLIDHYRHLPGLQDGAESVAWFGDHARFIVGNLPNIDINLSNPRISSLNQEGNSFYSNKNITYFNTGQKLRSPDSLPVAVPTLRELQAQISVRLYNHFKARFGASAVINGVASLQAVAAVPISVWSATRGVGTNSLDELRCLLKRFDLIALD